MKKRPSKTMEAFRVRDGEMGLTSEHGNNGQFLIPYPDSDIHLLVQISDGLDWDHASVSVRSRDKRPLFRCPTWLEMCYVKEMFFKASEWVVQYHPPKDENINMHPYVLHLWRPQLVTLPTPPRVMV